MGDQWGIAMCWFHLGGIAYLQAALTRSEECYGRSLALMERQGDPNGIGWVTREMGLLAWRRGDLAQAEVNLQRAAAIWDHLGHELPSAWIWCLLGGVASERGDLEAAVTRCRRARCLARGGRAHNQAADANLPGVQEPTVRAVLWQARAYVRAGQLRRADALLTAARTRLTTDHAAWDEILLGLVTAELRLRQGSRPAEARAAAEEALRLARENQGHREEALARCLLGRCALREGDPAGAEGHLRAALHQQVERGAALEAARTRLVLAEALWAQGERGNMPDEARTALAEARAQFAASMALLDLAEAEQVAHAWDRQ
jgi:tetratricopeptide (TPR) repeat protein